MRNGILAPIPAACLFNYSQQDNRVKFCDDSWTVKT
jgi:hypothetical protein